MALYKYTVIVKEHEDFSESGTVAAKSETEAVKKLQLLDFKDIRVKKVEGIFAAFRQFSADVR